jgi:general stress protein 26
MRDTHAFGSYSGTNMRTSHLKGRPHALTLLPVFLMITLSAAQGQGGARESPTRARLISAARDVMLTAGFCALITVDETGLPQARVMDPFPPDDRMVVWFGTNPKSRKVKQIRHNPRVSLHYFDPEGFRFVTIAGRARLVDDPQEKAKRWKSTWEGLYPNRDDAYLLIEVTPERLEVLDPQHGIVGDPETWAPPSVQFDVQGTTGGLNR